MYYVTVYASILFSKDKHSYLLVHISQINDFSMLCVIKTHCHCAKTIMCASCNKYHLLKNAVEVQVSHSQVKYAHFDYIQSEYR